MPGARKRQKTGVQYIGGMLQHGIPGVRRNLTVAPDLRSVVWSLRRLDVFLRELVPKW